MCQVTLYSFFLLGVPLGYDVEARLGYSLVIYINKCVGQIGEGGEEGWLDRSDLGHTHTHIYYIIHKVRIYASPSLPPYLREKDTAALHGPLLGRLRLRHDLCDVGHELVLVVWVCVCVRKSGREEGRSIAHTHIYVYIIPTPHPIPPMTHPLPGSPTSSSSACTAAGSASPWAARCRPWLYLSCGGDDRDVRDNYKQRHRHTHGG